MKPRAYLIKNAAWVPVRCQYSAVSVLWVITNDDDSDTKSFLHVILLFLKYDDALTWHKEIDKDSESDANEDECDRPP